MELSRLLAVPLSTLDGEHLTGAAVVVQRSLLMLIDAYRINPERSAAEIGWVQERLDPAIDLILIWPVRAVNQARSFRARNGTRMFLDASGEFRRLVSPSGKGIAVLVAPESGAIERISGVNPIFDVGHAIDGVDRTIDLGDVYHELEMCNFSRHYGAKA